MSSSRRQKRSPVHVCSLSMSPLTAVQRELKDKLDHYSRLSEDERTHDKQLNDEINQLRWVELSMQYNRQTQLQFVLQHLGDKGSNPAFRQAQMRPLFSAWKREVLRQRWHEINEIISNQAYGVRLQKRFDQFANQRTTLAAKNIKNCNFITNKPLLDLINIDDPFENLQSFQTKEAQSAEFYDEGLNYLASSAVKTFSTLPTEETLEENKDKMDEELRQRLIARGLILDDDMPQEKLLSASERAVRSHRQEDIKKKSNALKITIIVVIILIIIIFIAIFISKRNAAEALRIQQEQCYSTYTPTPKPTKTPRPTKTPKYTPTPTPKKAWFW